MLFLNTILDMIFPAKCLSCGEKGSDLCLACLSLSPPAERESAEWIFPLYDYRHPIIKKALWLFKYKGRKRLAGVFAEIIYEKILEELSELGVMENFFKPILIPIPLSSKRYRERGYNQAELICKELIKINDRRHLSAGLKASEIDLKLENKVLLKIKDTEHQARLKERNARLKNLSGSFVIKSGKTSSIKDKNIILIDDILTTGATLSEARRVLKQMGARKIIAFTVAH